MLCCPVCKKRDVYPVAGGYVGQIYRCKSCGYRGSFVLETDEECGQETGNESKRTK
jgi:transposase-like protein